MLVKVKPLSKWAKNRVHEHGDTMELADERMREGEMQMRLVSTEKTWTLCEGIKMHWSGWFGSKDAEIEKIK
jgi:hypothetical protein